jgi:hypothetical protein
MPISLSSGAFRGSTTFAGDSVRDRLGASEFAVINRFDRPELVNFPFFPQPQPQPLPLPFPFPFPFPQPQPQPQPAPPASPTASASDLQVLIASIPVAQEGHVISSEYHNALRNALVAIANRMGLGTIAEEITVSSAPALTFERDVRGWEMDYGLARKPPDVVTGSVHGWMELELPDGARIKKMVIFGKNVSSTGTATTAVLRVLLRRQKITDPSVSSTLIEVTVGDDALRGVEGDVTLPGTGSGTGAIEEFRVVNNREHKYLLIAELNTIDGNTSAQINAIQVVCGR